MLPRRDPRGAGCQRSGYAGERYQKGRAGAAATSVPHFSDVGFDKLTRREDHHAAAATRWEVSDVAGHNDARGRRRNGEKHPVVRIGQSRRPRWNRRYSATEFVDGCKQNIDATRWKRQLRSPEYVLVLSTNRIVEYKLQMSGESSLDDATGWTRSGEQTGNEDVRVEDDLHPRTQRGRERRVRVTSASMSADVMRAAPLDWLSRRIARRASRPRARCTTSIVSSTEPASTGSSTATGRPLAAVSRASSRT